MQWLLSPWPWLVLAVAGALTWWCLRLRTARLPGFHDYLRDPGLARQLFADKDAARQAALQWNDSQVREAAWTFVFDTSRKDDFISRRSLRQQLAHQAMRAAAHVLDWLGDPQLRPRLLQVVRDRHGSADSPAQRACELLQEHPVRRSVPLLAELLASPEVAIRKEAALAMASIGVPETLPALKGALADADDFVRSSVLTGLRRAADANRLGAETKSGLFNGLLDLVGDRCDWHRRDDAAGMVMEWDRTRATVAFRQRGLLEPPSPGFTAAMTALTNAGELLPRDQLLAHWSAMHGVASAARSFAAVVVMIGAHRHADDRRRLEQLLKGEPDLAMTAMYALLAWHGCRDYWPKLCSRLDAHGFAALASTEQQVLAVTMLSGEIDNGGLDQYFFNSSGDWWREALTGLDAMAATERAAVMRAALSRFQDEPATVRDARMDQLARLHVDDDRPFDDLDKRWYQLLPRMDLTIGKYVIANASVFAR